MKWEEETGAVGVFRKPSNYANGNTRDRQGRLITCEMDAQRLTRTEYDGSITVLAESFEGKKLTGPNDVVVKSDNSIWFSDNGAGIRGNYLGHKAPIELPFRVYRLDTATKQLTIAVGDRKRPNGLAFSPDEKLLYVIDTPGPGQRTIQVYDVVEGGTKTANRREFNSAEPGGSDGMRVDVNGNLWCAWSGGEAEDGVVVLLLNKFVHFRIAVAIVIADPTASVILIEQRVGIVHIGPRKVQRDRVVLALDLRIPLGCIQRLQLRLDIDLL